MFAAKYKYVFLTYALFVNSQILYGSHLWGREGDWAVCPVPGGSAGQATALALSPQAALAPVLPASPLSVGASHQDQPPVLGKAGACSAREVLLCRVKAAVCPLDPPKAVRPRVVQEDTCQINCFNSCPSFTYVPGEVLFCPPC